MLNLSVHVYAKQSQQQVAPSSECRDVSLVLTDAVTDPAQSACDTDRTPPRLYDRRVKRRAMRRPTGLTAWKMTITPLLLLSSMVLNSAGAAANNTGGHDVPSLLALVASHGNQPEITGSPEMAARSPSSARAWQRYQLAKLPPWLQLDETSLSRTPRSRDRSLLSRETRTSRPHAAATPTRAFFPRNTSLKRSGDLCCTMDMYCFMCVN